MTIIYEYCAGSPAEFLPELKLSMTQYLINNDYVKVGITSNPKVQWAQHSRDESKWSKMIVVFQSSSIIQVRTLEKTLVEHGRKHSKHIQGGAGENKTKGMQHVYFLIKD
jgi:hypothetical protein